MCPAPCTANDSRLWPNICSCIVFGFSFRDFVHLYQQWSVCVRLRLRKLNLSLSQNCGEMPLDFSFLEELWVFVWNTFPDTSAVKDRDNTLCNWVDCDWWSSHKNNGCADMAPLTWMCIQCLSVVGGVIVLKWSGQGGMVTKEPCGIGKKPLMSGFFFFKVKIQATNKWFC